ncbi:MAG TPA: hypothetical protein VMW58_06805 [Anaerolineae bacterium]|nr:hypothetical protein [Anaerolineae bacterium]
MRIYLATPIHDKLYPITPRPDPEFENSVKSILGFLRSEGHSVFLALEREEWGAAIMSGDVCTPKDRDEMQGADVVVAMVGNPPSGGVQYELGWATGDDDPEMRKPVVLLLDDSIRDQYSSLVVPGTGALTNASCLYYEDLPEERLADLSNALLAVAPVRCRLLTPS